MMDAVLGIDVAKAKSNVTLLFPDGRRRREVCANKPAGCAELLTWLTHAQRDLLTSIPGIGEATPAPLIAERFNKAFTSARHAAAFAGVIPCPHGSGIHEGRRVMCQPGPGRLRKGLHFPASPPPVSIRVCSRLHVDCAAPASRRCSSSVWPCGRSASLNPAAPTIRRSGA
jgi:transposase